MGKLILKGGCCSYCQAEPSLAHGHPQKHMVLGGKKTLYEEDPLKCAMLEMTMSAMFQQVGLSQCEPESERTTSKATNFLS